ncbi:MAG: holo-ACP synthase [Chloroflexi bacterium]|nr:holo-ACP synthase [Chloroflexota bacterium]
MQGSEVIGVGIDLCELDRIESLLERLGDKFLRRAYNPGEIAFIQRGRCAAARCAELFAGKEAVVKCLGTGFAAGVGWKQVEIEGGSLRGEPWRVRLHGEAAALCAAAGPSTWSLDIRCTKLHALAVAVWASSPDATPEENRRPAPI